MSRSHHFNNESRNWRWWFNFIGTTLMVIASVLMIALVALVKFSSTPVSIDTIAVLLGVSLGTGVLGVSLLAVIVTASYRDQVARLVAEESN